MSERPERLAPLLVPRPARLVFSGVPADVVGTPGATPSVSEDRSLPHRDAYRLSIGPGGVRIDHRSEAGLRFAHHTLAQLGTQYGERLPPLEILDYPALPTRGVMLDISRDRIPTMGEFLRVIPELAGLKLDHLQLYTEHTFAYSGHEGVWEGWNPITPAELVELEGVCASHGMELTANQNCFGHLTRWLERPAYASLAETHGEWTFDRFTRSGPFSLCPSDPGAMELVEDLLGQLLPLVRSGLVNVGCDETFDVGQGRSREEVARRGKAAVYFDFLDRVFEVVRMHGKQPMFWADVALNHPDAIARVPGDAIALAWGYEADADFDRWCTLLGGAGRAAWVCPGTSSWRSFTGRTGVRRANLIRACDAAAAHDLPGLLITDWGDSGHRQTWPVALVAIAEGADRAWNAGRTPVGSPAEPDPRAISLQSFGDRSLGLAGWLDALGDIDAPLRPRAGRGWFEGRGRPLENASVHFADLAEPWESDAIDLGVGDFTPLLERLTEFRGGVAPGVDPLIRDELDHTLDRTELALRRAIARRGGSISASVRNELLDLARHVSETHRLLWPHRSRPGRGLAESLSYDQRIVDELAPS